jgi:hypothetical protein
MLAQHLWCTIASTNSRGTCTNAGDLHQLRARPLENHRHSGIALFTPAEVHSGAWGKRWQQRDQAHQAYYDSHPERFRNRPKTPSPNPIVGINLPNESEPDRLQAA